MNSIELDLDLYFWFIDRADLEDDPRNNVQIEKGKVALHRDHCQRIQNGVHIARLLLNIRKVVIKKSTKPFPVNPQLNHLKDQAIQTAKLHNWELLQPELKKFGVKVTKE